jgi:thiamine biosynthesis protein ThiS
MIDIHVNGEALTLPQSMSIEELLKHLGYQDSFVAVAINEHCIPKSQFKSHTINLKDHVEILAPMVGG